MTWGMWIVVFLVLNFAGLGLGGWLMGEGPTGDWYAQLNKAPWTPPGWVFGVAWSIIMVCYSLYLAKLVEKQNTPFVWSVVGLAWVLNVAWNYVFFDQHQVLAGLIVLGLLLALIAYLFTGFALSLPVRLLLVPYLVWMAVAISLNGYILWNNG